MTTQTIVVEGLSKGWRAVAYRPPKKLEEYLFEDEIHKALENMAYSYLIVEKIQPRRVVLEEVEQGTHEVAFHNDDGCWTYWRYVKENDLSLTNAEPNVKMGVIQCDARKTKEITVEDSKELLNYLPKNTEFYKGLVEFIKENS